MSFVRTALCVSTALLASYGAMAETTLDQSHQKGLNLTIYQNGLGFVQDQRTAPLNKGAQMIAFEDISAQLIPDSLLISGTDFSILERRFAFDLLTPQILLEKSVGQKVAFRRLNPVTGKDELIKGKILSAQGQVVIERDGQIEVGQPGRLVLSSLPEGLRPKPALMARLEAVKKTNADLILAYLSNGLKWHTSYSVEVAEDGKSLEVKSWANLTNTSGADYKNVNLKLAAGNVNRRSAPRAGQLMRKGAEPMMAMAMDAAPERTAAPAQSLGGIHLYSLPAQVDLNNKETKQVALMSPLTFKSERTLIKRFGPSYGPFHQQPINPVHPDIELSFINTSGQPLPNGLARLYRQDQDGKMQFVGEDNLRQTPKDVKAKLHPGQSFDVTILRTQTDYEVKGKRRFEAAYKVVIKNAKKTAETIRIEEAVPGEWSLDKASNKPTETQGQRLIWSFKVPAGGEKVLTYRVGVTTR